MATKRGPYKKSRRTRAVILAAAAAEAARVGFQRTTMEAIARRARLAIGVVYYHFPSRNEVIDELLRQVIRQRFEVDRSTDDSRGGYLAKLERRFRDYLAFARRHPAHLRLFEELRTHRPKLYEQSLAATLSPMQRELREAGKSGEIRPMSEAKIGVVAHLLLGTAYFLGHLVDQPAENYPGDDFVVETYLDVLRNGLEKGRPGRP